jgi:hypothetical protein
LVLIITIPANIIKPSPHFFELFHKNSVGVVVSTSDATIVVISPYLTLSASRLSVHGYFSLILSLGLCLGKGVSNIVHVGLKNLHVFFMRFSVTA